MASVAPLRTSITPAFNREGSDSHHMKSLGLHGSEDLPRRSNSLKRISRTGSEKKDGTGSGELKNRRGRPSFENPNPYTLGKSGTGKDLSLVRSNFVERIRAKSRMLCESWRCAVLTTVLTIYALFGDDFRLAMTHKRTDILFNILTIFCIVVFTVEIVAASLGREGYFLGFFFVLDIGSTITLFLDLTWVIETVQCQSGAGDGSNEIRASRAGRAGARAGRTVRLIRLIRLVKLYKTYKIAIENKSIKENQTEEGENSPPSDDNKQLVPGDEEQDLLKSEDFDEDDHHTKQKDDDKETAETRVGKKLSDMTTRRVIVLVLVMLFVMPQFAPSTYFQDFSSSAHLGLEVIYDRWRDWCGTDLVSNGDVPWCLQTDFTSNNSTELKREARWWYETYLLRFLYSHHVGSFAWQLYWVGLDSISSQISELAQLDQARYLGSERVTPLSKWDAIYANSDWKVQITPLPESVKEKLTEPWQEKCSSFIGVSVSTTAMEAQQLAVCSIDEELRCSEAYYFYPASRTSDEASYTNMMFAFDTRGTTQLEAGLSMVQTIFICLAVGFGAMTFSKDSNQLLLNPIERMIAKMEAIKDNPLEAMKLGDLEYRREEIENAKRRERLAKSGKLWAMITQTYHHRKIKEPMETVILEKTIIKLGGLLALGFGEAGAEIIGHNMKGGATAGVNAMLPGSKVDAIIGFCNIRNFNDATEVLKEKVMLFVNQVGEIVHGCVDDYHGAPNKNIGDSFLLIWRLSGALVDKQTKLADMSVMSFVRILAAINKSPVLSEYRGHPSLLQRLPDYRVEMGFGLHCGWAIEGAIGSEFKIDASYLSPNVNVASRLEAATTQFGVWILISHFMVNLCSQEIAVLCRLIDHVTVKGSKQPVRLHTIDLDYLKLDVQQISMDRVIKNRFKVRQVRELRKNEKLSEDYNVAEAFNTDLDLLAMRSTYTTEFFQRFSMAYRNYEAGEWMVARDMFFHCDYAPKGELGSKQIATTQPSAWPSDGPAVTLLRFMEKSNFWPPMDWPGHRELTEK